MVSKPGPDYPFMCAVICLWNQPLSHLPADAKDKAHIGLRDLRPRLPGSAVALPNQPPDWPGRKGQSTAGAQRWCGLIALEPLWTSSWSIICSHLTDGDTEAQESEVTPSFLGILRASLTCVPSPPQQAVSDIVEFHTNLLQHRYIKPNGGLGSVPGS